MAKQSQFDADSIVFSPGCGGWSLSRWAPELPPDQTVGVRVTPDHGFEDRPAFDRLREGRNIVVLDLGQVLTRDVAAYYAEKISDNEADPIVVLSVQVPNDALRLTRMAFRKEARNANLVGSVTLLGTENEEQLQETLGELLRAVRNAGLDGVSLPPPLLRLFANTPESERPSIVIAEGVVPECLQDELNEETIRNGISPAEALKCGATMARIVPFPEDGDLGRNIRLVLDELQNLEEEHVGSEGVAEDSDTVVAGQPQRSEAGA